MGRKLFFKMLKYQSSLAKKSFNSLIFTPKLLPSTIIFFSGKTVLSPFLSSKIARNLCGEGPVTHLSESLSAVSSRCPRTVPTLGLKSKTHSPSVGAVKNKSRWSNASIICLFTAPLVCARGRDSLFEESILIFSFCRSA